MIRFGQSGWPEIEGLRARMAERASESLVQAGQAFAEDIASVFSSVVLARVFLVVPYKILLAPERELAAAAAKHDARLSARTRVLSLIGTYGRHPAYQDRSRSHGHLAVPLLDRAHVQAIPMIAKLLSDLEVDFAGLDEGRAIASQRMIGGRNGKFWVPDAQTAVDGEGRFIIPARDFVAAQDVHTVFGMGGAYVDGALAITVVFTNELIDTLIIDRFPSLISSFKMATTSLLASGRIYA